jgi:hypothetical protein
LPLANHFSSLLSAGMEPPLAGKREGAPLRRFSAHEREARVGSFFLFVSFHSLTTAPSCRPSVTRRPLATRRVFASPRVAPSSCVAPVASRRAFVTCRPVASRIRHASPLSHRAFVMRRLCRVAPRPCRVPLRHASRHALSFAPSSRVASPRRDARFGPAVEMEVSVSGRVSRVECKQVQGQVRVV